MTHFSPQTRALHQLLATRRTAALGTVQQNGQVFVSMVPYAINPVAAELVIHVSKLAAHTGNMQRYSLVSLLIVQAENPEQTVLDLPRVTLQATATEIGSDYPSLISASAAYLTRFPEAKPITQLSDFCFMALRPTSARQISGFGAARTIEENELTEVLRNAPAQT